MENNKEDIGVLFELSAPYSFEGVEYTVINLDLESLTGRDISQAKKEWTALGNFSAVISTDMDFAVFVAARASNLPAEFFYDLPAKDFTKVAQTVTNFLLS